MALSNDDTPVPGVAFLPLEGPLNLPPIVFGAATFSNYYNGDDHLQSNTPIQTVRLALRYGITAFDTSVYYGPSEVVLGNALQALKHEFPRSSYKLMTKCGRFGRSDFDYTPSKINNSVKHSLERLQTDYLDIVYLHDVEYVCTPVSPRIAGNALHALTIGGVACDLAEADRGKVLGEGDRKVLEAFAELRKLQGEGLVKYIGITGYPLPTLLRLALLILHNPPYEPVDAILSYSHLSLQNSTFLQYVSQLRRRAKVRQLVVASPFSMGLLTPSPPSWHPAPIELRAVVKRALDIWPPGLPDLALGFSIRNAGHKGVPLVAGFSTPLEVHECVRVWRLMQEEENQDRKDAEDAVRELFKQSGFLDWSWVSI